MALIECPECGKEISSTVSACVHCGYILNETQNQENNVREEQDCISIYKKDKNNETIFQIFGFIYTILILVCVALFIIELSPLLSLNDFSNSTLEQQLKIMDDIVKGQSNLENYQTIAVITVLLASLIPCFINHHQNKLLFNWLQHYRLEKSLEKSLTINLKKLTDTEFKKEKAIISKLLNGKVYDKKLQMLNFCNTCASGIFCVFLCVLAFSTLSVAYKKAIITTNINWSECLPTPLVVICVFFLIIEIIFEIAYKLKLKNKKKEWIKQNVENGYVDYLKYFK